MSTNTNLLQSLLEAKHGAEDDLLDGDFPLDDRTSLDDSEKNLEDKSLFGKLVQLQLRQI
jgi:hypothetical protein